MIIREKELLLFMKRHYKGSFIKILFLSIIITTLIGIILNPTLSLSSASSGLSIWFNIVIPSLLPFLIISEILIRLGFVDFLGKLLEPLMRPLLNLPGEAAFPLTMSLISGYPVGTKLTSRLREERLISKNEGDRLISFTSTSGPLFMLGAVSVSMLGDPGLAPLVLIPHYLGVFALGFFSRLYDSRNRRFKVKNTNNIFDEIHNSYKNWLNTKQSIGSLISKSIRESMDTIILIGGLIVFYSVLVEILFNMRLFNNFLFFLQKQFSLPSDLTKGFFTGVFEVTIGCKNIASSNTSLLNKVLIINFLIGWGGLSVHSQGFSFINNTDINGKIYIISKFFHGILSTIFTYLLYVIKYKNYIQPTFVENTYDFIIFPTSNWFNLFSNSTKLALLMGLYMFILSIVIHLIFKILVRSS